MQMSNYLRTPLCLTIYGPLHVDFFHQCKSKTKNYRKLQNMKTILKYNTAQKMKFSVNPLNADPAKWSNTLKQFVGNLPTNCLSVFYYFVGLAFKGLQISSVNVTKSAGNCGFGHIY